MLLSKEVAMDLHKRQYIISETIVRLVLFFLFEVSENIEPFRRKIQVEELWLYKNPKTLSYIPLRTLMVIISIVPSLVLILFIYIFKQKADVLNATFGFTLAVALNGLFTNFMKLIVGRPRPDFFWRCFPDGQFKEDMKCTGHPDEINDGLKSFPSGHSSFAFAALGFLAFYVAGKLNAFNSAGRGQSWRLCISILPLIGALGIALSRTCDYHHHWQDVLVGSTLGLVIAYLCYRQYFPSLTSVSSDQAYPLNCIIDQSHIIELISVKSEVKSV